MAEEDDGAPGRSTRARRTGAARGAERAERGAEEEGAPGGRTKKPGSPMVGGSGGGSQAASARGGEGRAGRATRPPPPPQQSLRLRRRLQPPPPQPTAAAAATAAAAGGAAEEKRNPEKQKTPDVLRVRLRRSEHARHGAPLPDAAPTTEPFTSGKMLKQCVSPGESDEPPFGVKEEEKDFIEVVDDGDDGHSSPMTTATSPPPPQQQQEAEGQRREDAVAEEPEQTSTDLGARSVCPICDGVLESDAALDAHIQERGFGHVSTPVEVDGFGCHVCHRVFSSADVLDMHVLAHPGEQVFKCPLCGLSLRSQGSMNRHLLGHRKLAEPRKRRHADDVECEEEAKRRSPSSAEGVDEEEVRGQRFTCPVCPTTQPFHAPFLHELETHLEQSHHDYRVSCNICGDAYRSVRDLNLHHFSAHRGSKSRPRDVVGFKDLTFVDFSSRKFALIAQAECERSLHRAISRQHPFQCECGRAFPCDSALAFHRQACPNTVYVDPVASTTPADLSRPVPPKDDSTKGDFFAKLDLLNNSAPSSPSPGVGRQYVERDLADIQSMLSVSAGLGALGGLGQDHAEEHEEQQDAFAAEFRRMKQRGEFPCRLCPEVFPNLRALKGHNRAHMSAPGADGYRCNMCPHSALDKMALQRHMRTHNGARPYECALCRFAFTTKANCERHLRNRHAKCSREEVKSSIIYHPSEDPGNDPELQAKLDVKRSLFAEPAEFRDDLASERSTSPPGAAPSVGAAGVPVLLEEDYPRDCQRRFSLDVGTMTSEDEADRQSPLDLSMVLDLSTKRPPSPEDEIEVAGPPDEDEEEEEVDDEQPQDLSRKSTSESLSASTPQSQEPVPFSPLGSLYVNPYQLGVQPSLPQGLSMPPGMPFSACYPQLPNLFRSLQLGGGLVLEPMRLPFLPVSPGVPGVLPAEPGLASLAGPAAVPAQPSLADHKEEARSNARSASPKSERSSASDVSHVSSHSKMVMKNGVLMPKQKQRRYRTERPHVCEHCSARFTLSSNRERHVKHQHPQFWSQRHRGPIVVNAPSMTSTPGGVPLDASTPLSAEGTTRIPTSCEKIKTKEEDDEDEGLVIDEEQPSSGDHMDDGVEGDAEDEGLPPPPAVPALPAPPAKPVTPGAAPAPGEDLVSVSRLLDNASTQTFRQFFRDGEEAAPAPPEEGSEEDEEGLVAGSPSEGNNSGSEKSESESAVPQKKKSAYSLAPNRVCCPYCARKFPWTSSLRRHVLTHTGDKPFKCTFCPLLFTTKSNCDRHLARKHSNKKDANSSSSGVSSGTPSLTPNSSTTSVSPGSSASGGSPPDVISTRPSALSPRNVPERPYKCRHCPSSTFATLSNLRKHVASKHTGSSLESCLLPFEDLGKVTNMSGYESHGSISDVEHIDDKLCDADSDRKLDMKVPLYSPVSDLQPLSLCKTERNDVDLKVDVKREDLGLCRTSESDRANVDIMREAHNSLISNVSPAAPISAPIVSIPEGSARPSESSMTLSSSELPFKCHLCDGSFVERQECLDHIRLNHASEYDILSSKGALELSVTTSPEDNNNALDENHHGDGENVDHMRGKFPDYANRKVMCAFCMRRFWSAEDLRRHMRTHTGERPFSCDVCRRRFTLKHSMLRHRKKHNDLSNNNNNCLSAPLVNSVGAGDLSPAATSGDEEGFSVPLKHAPSELLMQRVMMTNHNNNNINMAGVSKVLKAFCDNHVNLKRNFRRKEEEDSGLINNLLEIGDPSILDKLLLSKSPDDAAKLLGVYKNGSK